uniref:ZMYM2-like/QRICH1 C-terminal domain-containing protein n=2 Tax=Amphimedon queenslandica TaxID=400682 RepID=A0A1X7USH0_AMPQE
MMAYYWYTEHGSKNNLGGVKQVRKRQPNKVVKHFTNPSLGYRCLVCLLDLYISKTTQFKPDSSDSDTFYLRLMIEDYSCDDSEKQWFYVCAIGHNTLKGMVKGMCKDAGISFEEKSNHSLCAASATRMMDAGLQEKVIMDRTGHHSLDGLKPYSSITDLQQQ